MGRVDEEVRREVGEILHRKAHDPRLRWVSVTRTRVSRDLSVAEIFVSVLGDPEAQRGALQALQKAAAFVRAELGRGLRLRRVPELRFRYDRGIEHSLEINRILEELGFASADEAPASGDEGGEDQPGEEGGEDLRSGEADAGDGGRPRW